MRETFWKGLVVVASLIGTFAVVGWVTTSSLTAELDDAKINAGLLWFAAFGFVTGTWGLVALVWTFYEQRKLTQVQERAIISKIGGSLHFHPVDYQDGWELEIAVFNSGRTHAMNVVAEGTVSFSPHVDDQGRPDGEAIDEQFLVRCLQVNPDSIGVLRGSYVTSIAPKRMIDATFGSGGPGVGTQLSSNECITLTGSISYKDIFGRTHSVGRFSAGIYAMKIGMPIEFDLSDRSVTARYEQMRK